MLNKFEQNCLATYYYIGITLRIIKITGRYFAIPKLERKIFLIKKKDTNRGFI